MKKVVFVIESLAIGGAEKSLVSLLNNLQHLDYDIDLILFHKGGKFEKLVPKEINIVYKTIDKPYSIASRLKYFLLKKFNKKWHAAQLHWKTFNKYISKNEKAYDVAIAYNQGFATYYVADKIKAKKKYAWINTDYQKAGYQMHFDKKYYQVIDKIIAVSQAAAQSVQQALQNEQLYKEVSIIKDIVDDKQIKEMAKQPIDKLVVSKDTIKIVSVGRLVKPKAFDLAIKSCRLLIDKGYNVKWFIIGKGSERKSLNNLITSNKLENKFVLLGQKNNPYPYMKQADIYVQTSTFEGYGLTLIEASILNKAIVSTNFPSASGIITHNKTGLICPMNHYAITNCIIKYIESPNLKKTIVQNLTQFANTDKVLSLKKISDLLEE